MNEHEFLQETARCLSCPNPRCQTGCPTENLIKEWIFAGKTLDFESAGKLLYSVNPFPELTSFLCDYDRQCKGKCIRGIKGEPINIPSIEAFISSKVKRDLSKKESNHIKVCFVGAGPSSLSGAYFLLKEGFEVTIYEKENFIGGAILTGIPSFRFDKKALSSIYNDLTFLGCKFIFRKQIGVDIDIDELKERFDYIVLNIGAEKENTVGNKETEGFVGGLSLLHDLNVESLEEKYKKYKKVLVWGGGNVALDCARSLKRIIDDVSIIYRRSRVEMPGNNREVEEAIEENISFLFLENIESLILDEKGKLIGVNTVKMGLGDLDESGRRSFYKIEGSESKIDCDLVVAALGEKPDFSLFNGIETSWDKFETNDQKILISGDACTGPKNIASAITSGRNIAKLIMSKYGGCHE